MPLSREELRRQLRESLNADADTESKPKSAKSKAPVAPKDSANPFRKKVSKPVVEEIEEDEDEGGVAVAEEEYEEDEEVEAADEPETTPLHDFIDRIQSLIDFVMDNGESLKSWLDSQR